FAGMGIATRGVPAPGIDTFRWLAGDHPIPQAASFAAGDALVTWCAGLAKDAPLLVLLSGGSSACVEVPAPGWTAQRVEEENRRLLRSGLSIEELNRRRESMSAIKGGKLGRRLLERTGGIRVWVLADTEPATAAATIGSALFYQ